MIDNYYAKQFYSLLATKDAIPEGDGTMLVNSLLLWTSEFCDASQHSFTGNLPCVLAGGAGGAIQMNRVPDLRKATVAPRHNRLLVSMLNAMGVLATQQGIYDTDSTGAYVGYQYNNGAPWVPNGSGPLPGL